MADTVLDPIAAALQAKLAALTLTAYTSGQTKALTAYKWEPKDFENLPASAVGLPEVERAGVDAPEDQLGSARWLIIFPVSIYFDMTVTDVAQMQALAAEAVVLFTKAIDLDNTIGNVVDEAKVITAIPFVEPQRRRPLAGYECKVEVLKQVPYT